MIYQSGWNDQFVIFHRNFLDLKRRIYKNHLRLLLLYINKKSLLIEKINSEFLLHYKLQIYKLLISRFTVHLILIIWKKIFTYIQIKTVIDVTPLPLRKSLFSQKGFRTEEKYNTCNFITRIFVFSDSRHLVAQCRIVLRLNFRLLSLTSHDFPCHLCQISLFPAEKPGGGQISARVRFQRNEKQLKCRIRFHQVK